MSKPHFQYHLSSPSNPKHGYITLGDEKLHRIDKIDEFYHNLGYTDDIRKSGLLPDEFVWFEYHKDNCKKSKACLQVKIVEYLSKHSTLFKEKYAGQYKNWLDNCHQMANKDAGTCIGCATQLSDFDFSA